MKTHTDSLHRKRSFLLVLPLLVLPLLTLAFWALGGGGGTAAGAPQAVKGLNLQLPEPQFRKEKDTGKLSLYQQARHRLQKPQDTGGEKFLHRMGLVPGEQSGAGDAAVETPPAAAIAPNHAAPGFAFARQDPNEEKINERLSQLTQLISQENAVPAARQKPQATGTAGDKGEASRFSQDVAKLETMMRTMGGGNGQGAADPEMQQLEGMLERILDIQHPERVKEKLQDRSLQKREQTFAVQAAPLGPAVTLLHQTAPPAHAAAARTAVPPSDAPAASAQTSNTFYSLAFGQDHSGNRQVPEQQGNILEAAVHETQTLLSGATVKLRLLQDVYLGGRLLPEGSLLYGTCQLRGERLVIEVSSIRSGNALLPVTLTAYDLDGMEGLYIPGALTRDAARQGAERTISQGLQLPTLSPSLGAQAMGAGIDAARNMLRKEVRQVKVTVKAGHLLLLRDSKASL